MPRNATLAQRIAWHRAHAKECACRPIPPKLLAQMHRGAPLAKKRATPKTADTAIADPRLARLVAAFAGDARVTSGGKGFGSSGLKVNGKLFAMIASSGAFVAKLPKDRVDALVRLGKGDRFDPGHGRVMKEWIALRGKTVTAWIALAREALAFVGEAGA